MNNRIDTFGIIVAMFVSLFIVVFFSWLAYDRNMESRLMNQSVDHTFKVRLQNKLLINNMVDAETGQRGYLLTRQVNFLEPYNKSRAQLSTTLQTLKTLVSDNPAQLQRLDTLQGFIALKNSLMLLNIDRVNRGQSVDFLELLKGKNAMDNIRQVSKRFDAVEEQLQAQRENAQQATDRSMNLILLLLSGTAVLFLLVFFRLLFVELHRRGRLQTVLEDKISELQRTNAELEQFAYVASHDLQEPLRKIQTFGERLLRKQAAQIDDDGKLNVQKINESAARMQQLINDLLAFSRTANTRERSFEPVDLNQVMKRVREELGLVISAKNAVINIEPLPDVLGISYQLTQLFVNLIANALKYSKPEVTPFLRIQYEEVSGQAMMDTLGIKTDSMYHRISVIDNGIGFEQQYAEKIFTIFQRLHTRHEYQGTGIGLAICKRIVANHKGFIFAESKVEVGSKFSVYLPVN